MNPKLTQIHSLCPACSECPVVEFHTDGTVRIGEEPKFATLQRREWNELVRAIKSGTLAELP
jgi:sarcosine oxidase delta subunit